jgi:hypothetical protein
MNHSAYTRQDVKYVFLAMTKVTHSEDKQDLTSKLAQLFL